MPEPSSIGPRPQMSLPDANASYGPEEPRSSEMPKAASPSESAIVERVRIADAERLGRTSPTALQRARDAELHAPIEVERASGRDAGICKALVANTVRFAATVEAGKAGLTRSPVDAAIASALFGVGGDAVASVVCDPAETKR